MIASLDFDGLVSHFFQDEILEVAGKIYKAGMSLLVIDTENKFVSTGFAKEVARVAQGVQLLSYFIFKLVEMNILMSLLYCIFRKILLPA